MERKSRFVIDSSPVRKKKVYGGSGLQTFLTKLKIGSGVWKKKRVNHLRQKKKKRGEIDGGGGVCKKKKGKSTREEMVKSPHGTDTLVGESSTG